jgi:Ca-activated chloride channel family protein
VLLHPALHLLRNAFQARVPGTPMSSVVRRLLLGLLWVGVVAALMRPAWLEPHTEVKTEGYDLMLTVDASHSMDALDFTVDGRQVSRMAVIKGVMGRFIDNRKGDRIGLVLFGNQAYVLSPLTFDTDAVRQLLDGVVPSIAGQGTAMGDAIALGIKKLRDRPKGSRVLVLVTDGENTSGIVPPLEAARLAAVEGVHVYMIGVGSNQEQVPIVENNQVTYRSDLGFDEQVMRQIAETSGGAYFRATDTHALEEIYRRIDEQEKSEAEARSVLIPQPLYRWPLAFALLCLAALGLFPEGQPRRITGRAHG